MADQKIPTSKGMSTSNSPDNQDVRANQGTATSSTKDSKDTSQSNANAGQSTSTSSTKDSKDASQSNVNADQITSTSSTEDSKDASQLNANAGQSTSTSSTKDSKDASQSNVNADQSTNTEGSQDTPTSNAAKNQGTSSCTLHLTKQSVFTVISTSRSLLPLTSTPFIKDAANAVFRVEALFLLAAFLVGCEANRSKQAFSLVLFSFLGGSEYSQRVPFHILLYFVAGFWVGVGAATVYVMLLLCLITYTCELNTRDAVLVGFSFLFGLLCNVSDQAFFLVVYSYFGGMAVRFDKEALIYLGLSFLIGSTGAFNFLAIPFSLPF